MIFFSAYHHFCIEIQWKTPTFKGAHWRLVGENSSIVGSWLVNMTNTVLLQGRQYYGLIIRE